MHRHVCLFGVAALLFLAVWLWEAEPCGCHGYAWSRPDPENAWDDEPDPVATGGIPTYDGGRTMIPPKISAAAIARLRGA
jgi:hypothetical protein